MLTRDLLKSDIADMLGMDPAEIGADDNLMDMGLDSMRALNLVLKWSEAGVTLEFGELAENPTLEGWWQIIAARQA